MFSPNDLKKNIYINEILKSLDFKLFKALPFIRNSIWIQTDIIHTPEKIY